jgi:3-deoxy-D-manno-octulosonic-acid transferase
MKSLYTVILLLLRFGMRIASLFDSKASLFVTGRKDLLKNLSQAIGDRPGPVVWFHCASLGEFEQARPLIEMLKNESPQFKILLTFFSPSGYEIRKNYSFADFVFYLPWDTASNAKRFVTIAKPVLAIFVKYEFWHYYARELKQRNIPLLSVSSIFRSSQLFFKSYGGFYRNILKNFSHFFVQNEESTKLLKSIGIDQCTLAGDTRFDRVMAIVQQNATIDIIRQFKGENHCWVIGSSWPEDLDVFLPLIHENTGNLKFIIAPHEIDEGTLAGIEKLLKVPSVRFSKAGKEAEDATVLVVDTMGHLSKLYQYGEFAYVGGAFGKGLHNILEAACYGIPVFFGNRNYEKYQEAVDLIMRGGAFEISDYADLKKKYELLISRPENYLLACEVTQYYVKQNLGATEVIMKYCRGLLK